jgi:hypothetical protein
MNPQITNADRFEAWLLALDDICYTELGVSYKDLPDQLFKDWYDDNLSPEDAYYHLAEDAYPGTEVSNIFYQPFDTFSDADPGL